MTENAVITFRPNPALLSALRATIAIKTESEQEAQKPLIGSVYNYHTNTVSTEMSAGQIIELSAGRYTLPVRTRPNNRALREGRFEKAVTVV